MRIRRNLNIIDKIHGSSLWLRTGSNYSCFILGDVSVNGFQNFYSTPQRSSAARKSFTTSNSELKNAAELDYNRQNGVVSAREFDLSASLPALTRDARLSSMRSQSASLHQVAFIFSKSY